MRRVLFRMIALAAVFALPVTGAQAVDPIQDVENQSVAEGARGPVTAEQVGRAVLAAGAMRDWQMTPADAGVIKAVYAQRDFSAEVRVDYTATAFSIHYVTSQNLKYGIDKKTGQPEIHANYNRWVNNLRVDTLKLLPFMNCGD